MAKAVQLKDKNGNKVFAAPWMPIGSIFLTVSNDNPSKYFGGTWEKISGGFLYACVNNIDNNVANTPGTGTYNHTLTVAQIPSHGHEIGQRRSDETVFCGYYAGTGGVSSYVAQWRGVTDDVWNYRLRATETGGGQGHSHDIPHIGVWVWKRIA